MLDHQGKLAAKTVPRQKPIRNADMARLLTLAPVPRFMRSPSVKARRWSWLESARRALTNCYRVPTQARRSAGEERPPAPWDNGAQCRWTSVSMTDQSHSVLDEVRSLGCVESIEVDYRSNFRTSDVANVIDPSKITRTHRYLSGVLYRHSDRR